MSDQITTNHNFNEENWHCRSRIVWYSSIQLTPQRRLLNWFLCTFFAQSC